MNKFFIKNFSENTSPTRDYESSWVTYEENLKKSAQQFNMLCSICGNPFLSKIEDLDPNVKNCTSCESTVRWRSIAAIVSILLTGKAVPLPMIPPRLDIKAMGMSCMLPFAKLLSEKINFINTFFDKEPKFDIANIPSTFSCLYDLVISVEILEHVIPPVSVAFQNLYKILNPGGVLVMSVPFTNMGETIEHFPKLFKFHLEKKGNKQLLVNIKENGEKEEFTDLVFHGGSGFTLEMRRFSRSGLVEELRSAGFRDIHFLESSFLPLGVYFKNKWSLPLVAVK